MKKTYKILTIWIQHSLLFNFAFKPPQFHYRRKWNKPTCAALTAAFSFKYFSLP